MGNCYRSPAAVAREDVMSCNFSVLQDGHINYNDFAAMMKSGSEWRMASRQYMRGRFNNLSINLMKDASINSGE